VKGLRLSDFFLNYGLITIIIIIIIIIKNNIIIIIKTFPACFAPENFSMLNNLVNLWSKRTLYHKVFTPAGKLAS